ncbi:MAG: CvpA family protein [Ruminococcus sp.]|nr:CvpA family protein [Ruminococcus sp.]MBR1753048.1 CvpA family protein [Ruminococcus sp.]
MATILDVAVVLIVLVSSLTCCIKGFVRTIFGFAGTAVSLIVAVVVALAAADSVYENFLKGDALSLSKTIAESIDPGQMISDYIRDQGVEGEIDTGELNQALSADGDLSENTAEYLKKKGVDTNGKDIEKMIDDYIDNAKLPEELAAKTDNEQINSEALKRVLKDSKEEIVNTLKAAANEDKDEAAKYIEQTVVSPIAKKLTRYALGAAVFVVCKLIFSLIVLVTGVVNKISMVRKTDMLLGFAVGFVSGMVSVMIIVYSFSVFLNVTNGGIPPVTKEMTDQTIVFKLLLGVFG